MGEAKRRKQAGCHPSDRYRLRNIDDPNIRAMFGEDGTPLNVALVGAGLVLALAATGKIPLDAPGAEPAAMRRAFGLWDRIRTGEVETWPCALCETRHFGLADLSCFGVIMPIEAPPPPWALCFRSVSAATASAPNTQDAASMLSFR